MNKTELILAPGTSPRMRKIAESIPPYDLLKAYRDAVRVFDNTDIVLVVAENNVEGFQAFPRGAYIEQAFRRWNDHQRAAHPIAQPAHKKMQMPVDSPAFWLVVEMPESGEAGFCAIGAYLHTTEVAAAS